TPPRHLQTFRLDAATLSAFIVPISLLFGHPREADMGLEIWREITSEYNGRAINGSFKFLDGVVTVRTLHGSKAAQVRGQTPEQLAKALLRELARDGMA